MPPSLQHILCAASTQCASQSCLVQVGSGWAGRADEAYTGENQSRSVSRVVIRWVGRLLHCRSVNVPVRVHFSAEQGRCIGQIAATVQAWRSLALTTSDLVIAEGTFAAIPSQAFCRMHAFIKQVRELSTTSIPPLILFDLVTDSQAPAWDPHSQFLCICWRHRWILLNVRTQSGCVET